VACAPSISTTPAANLPPVSTTPAANFATGTAGAVDTGSKFAIGENLLKVLTLLPQKRCKKIIENFLIADFFHLLQVSTTLVVHLELLISHKFSKNLNRP
jgi:hypothetical protein